MPTYQRLGANDCENLKDRWEPAIELNEEPPIAVRKLGALLLTLRRKTISCCRSAAFSASSRIFDLNGEASTARTKQTSAIIAPKLADSIAQ